LEELAEQVREFRASQGKTKPSRAQKRKEKKTAKEKKREDEIKEEVKGMADPRAEENTALRKKLLALELPLTVKEIRSDGHCLYRAIADQLSLQGHEFDTKQPYSELRQRTAKYMTTHSDLFRPFVTNNDGLPLSDDEYKVYVNHITNETDVVWGGHAEIVALAHSLNRKIIVHSALGTPLIVQPPEPVELNSKKKIKDKSKNESTAKADDSPLNISYHKYYYGLGEHYNSAVPV